MNVTIRWTPDALKSFHHNIEYLQQIWPSKVEDEFMDRVEEILMRIKSNPYLFPIHRLNDNIHKCVINPRMILYYRIIDKENIDLLLFWNTWQNPDKINL